MAIYERYKLKNERYKLKNKVFNLHLIYSVTIYIKTATPYYM